MRLLPVLDLLNRVVVRGVAGKRETYLPVRSQFVDSAEPLEVARAFCEQFGLRTLYVADLDAILHSRPNLEIYRRLAADGFGLWIDAGIRDVSMARLVLDAGANSVIVGLESTASPQSLQTLVNGVGREHVIFSLDLKHGRPLSDSPEWQEFSPIQIAEQALYCGLQRLIVLDLAQVGMSEGISTQPLCDSIRRLANEKFAVPVELITGGGVRNVLDLETLAQAGIDGALIASALHNGQLSRQDLERFYGENETWR